MVKHKNNFFSLLITLILIKHVLYVILIWRYIEPYISNLQGYKAFFQFTRSYFHTNRISYDLKRKTIVFNACEFSTLKPFNHILQKFHHKFHFIACYCKMLSEYLFRTTIYLPGGKCRIIKWAFFDVFNLSGFLSFTETKK